MVHPAFLAGGLQPPRVLYAHDEKASGTQGGTFTSGAWRVRTLNALVFSTIPGASLLADAILLDPGTYHVRANAPGLFCGLHQIRLFENVSGLPLGYGSSCFASDTAFGCTHSFLDTVITLAVAGEVILEHRCSVTRANDGFGPAPNFGGLEVFASMTIEQLS